MKRRLLIQLLLILLSSSFLFPITLCQESEVPEYTLDIPCFTPTKISFNYAYTHYHSVRDISTVGASLYKHTGGPTNLEFIAEDVDDYFFTLELRYEQPVNQTIMVGVWSGTAPMQGLDYKTTFTDVIFHVRLRVTRQPAYPTEEEVAQAVVAQVQKNLEDLYNEMNEREKRYDTIMMTTNILSVVSIAFMGVVSTVILIEQRRQRRTPR